MKATKVELVFHNSVDAEYFVTHQLKKIMKEYKKSLILCFYYDIEYVDESLL
jgi:hypothetical protein